MNVDTGESLSLEEWLSRSIHFGGVCLVWIFECMRDS